MSPKMCSPMFVAHSRQICHCFPACLPILITDWARIPLPGRGVGNVNVYTGDPVDTTALRKQAVSVSFLSGYVAGRRLAWALSAPPRAPRWCRGNGTHPLHHCSPSQPGHRPWQKYFLVDITPGCSLKTKVLKVFPVRLAKTVQSPYLPAPQPGCVQDSGILPQRLLRT